MHGLIGAYSKDGQEWADELKAVLTENMEWAYDFITKNWDGVELAKPEGTYMLYLDCRMSTAQRCAAARKPAARTAASSQQVLWCLPAEDHRCAGRPVYRQNNVYGSLCGYAGSHESG